MSTGNRDVRFNVVLQHTDVVKHGRKVCGREGTHFDPVRSTATMFGRLDPFEAVSIMNGVEVIWGGRVSYKYCVWLWFSGEVVRV
jgi:hypothetical protein